MRYHKDVFFSDKHKADIIKLTNILNGKRWRYTAHCLEKMRQRIADMPRFLYFIKNDLKLKSEDVFEFYTDDIGNISRLCYRFNFSKEYDVIIILGLNKDIITIYLNSADDNHETLKKELYCQH